MSALKIGWSEADITPDGEVDLYGQYYRRLSKGVHSRLGATVMALDGGDGLSVMISADLTNFTREFLDEVRDGLRGKIPGLDVSRMIMNATHTHSAPAVSPGRSWWEASKKADEYRGFVATRLREAVESACGSMRPAGVASVSDFAVVGHCRRAVYKNGTSEMYGDVSRPDFAGMEGGEDSTVEALFVFDENGVPTGSVVNVACPSQVMEATYLLSSDYMGELRRLLKEKFGPGFHTLCQISAAGCQSPRDLVRTKDDEFWSARGVEVLGKRVFDAALRAYDKAGKADFAPAFAHAVREIFLPKRKASYQDYADAQNEIVRLEKIRGEKDAFEDFCAEVKVNEKVPGRPGPYDSKLHHFVLIKNARAVVSRYEEQRAEPDFSMELHALRLGDAVFVTNPFELFLDFGLRIKAGSAASRTFVVQLACGSAAYLPTERAESLGGYGGLIINGVVGADGGTKLVDETSALTRTLFS